MRRLRYLPIPSLLVSSLVSTSVFAAPWVEDKGFLSENKTLASSKVDAADLNGDGNIDLVFANGAGFDKGDMNSYLQQQVFLNDGATMTDISTSVFEDEPYAARVVKLRDIDRDGDNDIILGTTWETQSQLLLNDGGGTFENVTDMNLPQGPASVGDLEVGDVDGDGDLDMVLSNWGPTGAQTVGTNGGGYTLLWTQMGNPTDFAGEGTGMFEDVTLGQMPNISVRWSWELEFVDVNNDYNLDIAISAYAGEKVSLFLFLGDGAGNFSDATAGNIPQGKYSLDVEPMDLNGDGAMDLLTLHDGVNGRNRLLINDAKGKFIDGTDQLWPKLDNIASYDTMAAFYDFDSNGKVDFLLGAFQLQYKDRLIYESAGKFKANTAAFEEVKLSNGTFALVLADFNKDTRLDVAMAQNENAFNKELLLASDEVPLDTVAPYLTNIEPLGVVTFPGTEEIRLRSHDNKSPLMLHDFKSTDGKNEGFPYMETWAMEPADPDQTPGDISKPGMWYGEYLWRVQFNVPDADVMWYRLCVIDAADNKRCTELMHTEVTGGTETESDTDPTETDTASDTDSDSAVSATITASDTDTESNSATMTATASDTDTESDTKGTMSASDSTPTDSASDGLSDSTPTDSNTLSESQGTVTVSNSDTESATNSDTAIDSASELDDDGCGCDTDGSPVGGVLSSLALLGLLGIRRRRQS